MNKQKIRQYSAVLLILFLIFVFGLCIYFALIGNFAAALSALAFNTFFSIVLFFLIKLNRYIKKDLDLNDQEDEEEIKK